MTEEALKKAVDFLKLSKQYRLIKRYEKPAFYQPDDGTLKCIGVFLDVKTTGSLVSEDKIIELGLVVFEYSDDGRLFRILEELNQYQDPDRAIPSNITELTGITDAMVAGKQLDKKIVFGYLNQADLIIAHQAASCRPHLEALGDDLPVKPWGCSLHEVPWSQEGLESIKLEYLAYRYGFFYEGHRASLNCLVGVHLLSQTLPRSQELVLKVLLDNSRALSFRLWVLGAPLTQKDILQSRRYCWESYGKYKAWFIELSAQKLLSECQYLWQEIYGYEASLPVEVIEAKNRFSKKAVLPEYWVSNPFQVEALIR